MPLYHPMSATADHVTPLSDGGAPLDRANVRAAHRFCNQVRHREYLAAKRLALRGEPVAA